MDFIDSDDINVVYDTFGKTILNVADQCIPKLRDKINTKKAGNAWWTPECEKAVEDKKEKYKMYINYKTPESHNEMKYSKIKSNRIIAQAKRQYWNNFCNTEIREAKDMQKMWNKLKVMRNGVNLPKCQIQLDNVLFPTNTQKAEAFVDIFANVSRIDGLDEVKRLKRVEDEKYDIYTDPIPDNTNVINALISIQELKDAIILLSNKKTSVGVDAISNEMIKHLPDNWINALHRIISKI